MTYSDRKFRAAHGKRPSGRGVWWFHVDGTPFVFSGHLGQAKKEAMRFAKHTGAQVVELQS